MFTAYHKESRSERHCRWSSSISLSFWFSTPTQEVSSAICGRSQVVWWVLGMRGNTTYDNIHFYLTHTHTTLTPLTHIHYNSNFSQTHYNPHFSHKHTYYTHITILTSHTSTLEPSFLTQLQFLFLTHTLRQNAQQGGNLFLCFLFIKWISPKLPLTSGILWIKSTQSCQLSDWLPSSSLFPSVTYPTIF